MSKITIITKREYLSRVKKRSFLLATFLTPIVIFLFSAAAGAIFSNRDGTTETIAVIDANGSLASKITDRKDIKIVYPTESAEVVRAKILSKELNYTGLLVIPKLEDMNARKYQTTLYTDKRLSPDANMALKDMVSDAVRDYKVQVFKLDTAQIKALNSKISIEPEPLDPKAEKKETSITFYVTMAISAIMGLIMYLSLFIYGSMIMRSVMEEKTSRIVEVMISSVKPFELMMGKIIGVGLVGFTQLIIWIIFTLLLSVILPSVLGIDTTQTLSANQAMSNPDVVAAINESQQGLPAFLTELGRMNWWFIIPVFIFYFLGGFMLYAALFAALGSAVGDDMNEAQALTIPVTMPIIFGSYIAYSSVLNPESTIAQVGSYFPLFSPIVMPARLAAEPPVWQVLLSMSILVASIIFFVWLAARIYRVGILMYGKQPSFKEFWKWMFYKS
jgi:ABC-2 type transport system permease protein